MLYPGELNQAVARGESLVHLAIRPSSEGGQRAICHANDTSSCDGGYKPLDCASYPLFPTIDAAGKVTVELIGQKCPLVISQLQEHRLWVQRQWQILADASVRVREWIGQVSLVGYRKVE